MQLLPFIMAKSSAGSVTICLTPTNTENAPLLVCRGIEGQERIFTYIEAVNHLLNSFANGGFIAKAALEVESFKTHKSQMAVKFAEALKDDALRCRDASSKRRTKCT